MSLFFSFFCLVVAPSMAWRSLVPVPLDLTIGHEDTPAHASASCACCSLASTQEQCQWSQMKRRAVSLLVTIWSPSRQRLAVFPASSAHRHKANWTNWNEGCSTLFCSQSLRSKTSRMRMMIKTNEANREVVQQRSKEICWQRRSWGIFSPPTPTWSPWVKTPPDQMAQCSSTCLSSTSLL